MTRLDRRALFTSGAAAALMAATGMAPGQQPSLGGRIRIALDREGKSLNRLAESAIFDSLTEIAPDGVLRGELATGWLSDSDARRWDFTLREDAVFHDGKSLAATDTVASLSALPNIARIEATGPFSLHIELMHGNPDLPFQLADRAFLIYGDQGAGTGLYRAVRNQPDRHFLGQRVAKHYKDGQAGWLDAIDAIVIPDADVRAEALRDGYVDVAELPAPKGLRNRGAFIYHPSADDIALAARPGVGVPRVVAVRGSLDDGRLAERWWVT